MPRLENWAKIPMYDGDSLSGNIYGDPRFEDGKSVITSQIVEMGGGKAKTRTGTLYTLGKPLEEMK